MQFDSVDVWQATTRTVFSFQPVELNLIGLVLGLLLQTASSRCQLILLFARLWSHIEWQLTDRRHVVDGAAQFIQLLANVVQFSRIRCQIVTIALTCLTAVL